jgi:ABC-type bacteriocin/lantibiotic exporter with double-glycine peptidase domain
MSQTQATEALRLITAALGKPAAPAQLLSLARETHRGGVEDQLGALGASLELTFLGRPLEGAAIEGAFAEPGQLLVIVPDAGEPSPTVILLDGLSMPGTVVAWTIGPDGTTTPLVRTSRSDLFAEVRRLAGATTRALSPVRTASAVRGKLSRPVLALPGEGVEGTQFAAGHGKASYDEARIGRESQAVARLWSLLLRDRREVVVVFFYAALAGLFSLTLPIAVGGIVQLIQGGLIIQSATVLIVYAIIATIIVGTLQVMQLRVVERIHQRVFARMALEFTYRLTRIQYEVSLRENLLETMNRMFEAVNIQKSVAKFLLDTSTALLTIVFGLLLLALYHPYFILFGAVLVLGLGAIFWLTGARGLGTSLLESKYKYVTVHWLEEIASAIHAFKFAGRSRLALERMDEILGSYLKYRQRHFRVLIQQTSAMVVFRTLILAGLLILGTVLVVNRQISLGQFVAAEIVVVTVLAGVEKLVLSLSVIYDMLTSVEKAGLVADLPLDPVGTSELPGRDDGLLVEARDVRYTYRGGGSAVQGVSLRIERGQTVALTGYQGAGRSTLLRLLGGLLENYEGTLLFDGRNVRELDRETLRGRIGQVMSLTDLFDGTVQENVAVGRPDIDEAAVVEALGQVGILEEVQAMPNGLKTILSHGGRSLSSNIATKLLLAQGVAGKPRLILFDDFFMNLPYRDRRRLLELLTDKSHPWTVIAVSHDIELLEQFDRVIVLEGGVVVADGPFRELRSDPYVATLVQTARRAADTVEEGEAP